MAIVTHHLYDRVYAYQQRLASSLTFASDDGQSGIKWSRMSRSEDDGIDKAVLIT